MSCRPVLSAKHQLLLSMDTLSAGMAAWKHWKKKHGTGGACEKQARRYSLITASVSSLQLTDI